MSPLQGEKPQNRPVSKRNTGRAALRADPAGKNIKTPKSVLSKPVTKSPYTCLNMLSLNEVLLNYLFPCVIVLLLDSNGQPAIYLVAGPSNLTVLAGETVQLECAVSMPSSHDFHIIWARQGSILQFF